MEKIKQTVMYFGRVKLSLVWGKIRLFNILGISFTKNPIPEEIEKKDLHL